MGKFFITNMRIGQKINPTFWRNSVEPNDELSMTIVFDHVQAEQELYNRLWLGLNPREKHGLSNRTHIY